MRSATAAVTAMASRGPPPVLDRARVSSGFVATRQSTPTCCTSFPIGPARMVEGGYAPPVWGTFDDGAAQGLVTAASHADRVLAEQGAGRRSRQSRRRRSSGARTHASSNRRARPRPRIEPAWRRCSTTWRGRSGSPRSWSRGARSARRRRGLGRACEADRAERRDDDAVQWIASGGGGALRPAADRAARAAPDGRRRVLAHAAHQDLDRLRIRDEQRRPDRPPELRDARPSGRHRAPRRGGPGRDRVVALRCLVFVGADRRPGFVDGARRLVDENDADAGWIEHVAGAFEQAGNGTTDRVLASSSPPPSPPRVSTPSRSCRTWIRRSERMAGGEPGRPRPARRGSTRVGDVVRCCRRSSERPPRRRTCRRPGSRRAATHVRDRAAEKVGIDMATWQLDRGAPALMPQVAGSYEYYASLYLDDPALRGPAWRTWSARTSRRASSTCTRSATTSRRHVRWRLRRSDRSSTSWPGWRRRDRLLRTHVPRHAEGHLPGRFDDARGPTSTAGMTSIDELRARGAPPRCERRTRSRRRAVGAADVLRLAGHRRGRRRGTRTASHRATRPCCSASSATPSGRLPADARTESPTGEAPHVDVGIVGDASIPGTKTLGQFEGGIDVPVDVNPFSPGTQGWVDHWYIPRGTSRSSIPGGTTSRETRCPRGSSSSRTTPDRAATRGWVGPRSDPATSARQRHRNSSKHLTTRSSHGTERSSPRDRGSGRRHCGRRPAVGCAGPPPGAQSDPSTRPDRSETDVQHNGPPRRPHAPRGRRGGLGPHRHASVEAFGVDTDGGRRSGTRSPPTAPPMIDQARFVSRATGSSTCRSAR